MEEGERCRGQFAMRTPPCSRPPTTALVQHRSSAALQHCSVQLPTFFPCSSQFLLTSSFALINASPAITAIKLGLSLSSNSLPSSRQMNHDKSLAMSQNA